MGSRQPDPALAEALLTEQTRLTALYDRLDAVRERTRAALAAAHAGGTAGGTHQARLERDVSAAEHARRLAQLSAVEHGLCFGRTDDAEGRTLYIGRTGLRGADGEIVLTDWRAPAARPFYTATPADPGPLVRRRHLHTRERTVVGLDDEVFDLDRLAEPDRRTLVGEAALMAALRRGRTGRMSQVVATIQAEQDRVIRSGLAGALVVEGGPGTGKTVAALHRAAYLLYTHREVLSRRGILVIGPTALFSRYIGQVLPSLGETDVVVATVGELHSGVRAGADDPPAAAVVKGDLRMAAVVAAAVRDRQRLPDGDLEVSFPVRTSLRGGVEVVVEEMTLRASRAVCAAARDRARRSGRPHNVARRLFVLDVLRALAADEAARLDAPADAEDLAYARKALWSRPQVREALDALWPLLTPERLIGDLLSDPQALDRAAPRLTAAQRGALLRPSGSPWTTGDIPLLDEAAELLGVDDSVSPAAERAAADVRRKEEAYARGVLEFTGLAEDEMMEAAALAERHRPAGPHVTTAERAAADRTWVYGHVIVDEAQELSAMAWRTVMRRIPARSLTVVGDLAQTGSAAGARSWGEVLDPYVAGRWRVERLQVNYRTPVEIMEVAADVLAAVAPDRRPPESVREGGDRPRAVRASVGRLPVLVEQELEAVGEGRLAVIVPAARRAEVSTVLAAGPSEPAALDRPVAVLTPASAKGLEFDAVIVVEPAQILAGSPRGGQDLYVAVTRATRRLTVVFAGDLPPMLSRLARH
ncbi:DNA helicase [Planomonospora parontospora subsp. parontospora]|uniref:DNA helicase n=2 Tax=Planomonospora parontospora TaxID=58119 RepID=A0AA37BIM6_9ACTN|nr:ATP-binding domain-containing protein [Planomonospora parontospora]GGK77292.1 DNA helicase [Planomonospora parontospora]GII10025.1 DNA helicase [Planomonospora parontospora subsp. parontospora]